MTQMTNPSGYGHFGPTPPTPPSGLHSPDPEPKPRKFNRAALVSGGVALLIGFGLGSAGNNNASKVETVTPARATAAAVTVTAPPPAVAAPKTTVKVTQVVPPKKVFGDGSWLVGRDIKPGRYTTVTEVEGDMCYWGRHEVGTTNIIDNGIVNGGRPTIVVKKGEELRVRGCGDWTAA